MRVERAAVDRMLQAAIAALARGGHAASPATLERIADTLQAAGRDDEAGARLAAGTLDRELDPAGFGDVSPLEVVRSTDEGAEPTDPATEARARERRAATQAVESARHTLEGWQAAVDEAEPAEEATRKAAAEAALRAEDAKAKADDARARRDRAAADLEAAEARLADLED
jgi:hypothetical protein